MGKVAIIGKQQPRFIREAMVEYIKESGHEAVLMDMPTRNTADWKEELVGYDVLISAGEKIPAETIKYLKGSLKIIFRFGVGTDEMDHAEAVRQGIAICNAAGSFNRPVAECALALVLCLMRNIHLGNKEVHNCDWSRFNESRNGEQLYDKTVGLVGFGGKTLCDQVVPVLFHGFAAALQTCFGMADDHCGIAVAGSQCRLTGTDGAGTVYCNFFLHTNLPRLTSWPSRGSAAGTGRSMPPDHSPEMPRYWPRLPPG